MSSNVTLEIKGTKKSVLVFALLAIGVGRLIFFLLPNGGSLYWLHPGQYSNFFWLGFSDSRRIWHLQEAQIIPVGPGSAWLIP